jgi:hypothetical protein
VEGLRAAEQLGSIHFRHASQDLSARQLSCLQHVKLIADLVRPCSALKLFQVLSCARLESMISMCLGGMQHWHYDRTFRGAMRLAIEQQRTLKSAKQAFTFVTCRRRDEMKVLKFGNLSSADMQAGMPLKLVRELLCQGL